MSNKKTFTEITATDAKKKGVTALAVRPNDASRFGQGGLTADALKAWFDQLPKEIISKLNSVMKALNSSEGGKYIGIDALGVDNLHDFLALFGPRGTGLNAKNIADHIETLYVREGETEADSDSLRVIISDIVSRIVRAKAAQEALEELVSTATLTVDEDNNIRLEFDNGNKVVETSIELEPAKTNGIADGAVTTPKIASKAVTTDKIADGAVTNSKIASSLMQTIEDAFNEVEYDSKTGNLKFNSLGGSMSVNLPLELVVSDGRFDEGSKDIVLVLNNGEEIRIPLDDFVDQVAEDIAVLKKSFMGATVSDNKLFLTAHDGSEVEVDLPSSGGGISDEKLAEFDAKKLNRIDLVEYPHGDPTNPNATGDIGSYAGVYSEYYGNDGKWREKLIKANAAAYSNLSETAVDKFVGNLKTSRIPITDSNGRLSVPAPQKGANGQTHYYNPEASAATNNTYNAAIPLWYGDERYVRANTYTTDKNATDKKIASLEDAVANAGGGASAKLYRHDISLYATSDFSDCCFDIRLTIYDSNPNSYAAEKEIDWDEWEVISDIPIEKFSFLPAKTNLNASGVFLEIEDIYNDDGEHMGGASVTRIVLSLRFDPDHKYDDKFSFSYDGNALDWSPSYGGGFSISDVEYITDVVTEVK